MMIIIIAIFFSAFSFNSVANEPFIVLDYKGNTLKKGVNKNNPFLKNSSYNTFHLVEEGDSLSGIIKKYYSNTGLNTKILEVSIIEINQKAFVRKNPNYLFAGKKIKIPSINEIMQLVKNKPNSEQSYESSNHIYFFGGN